MSSVVNRHCFFKQKSLGTTALKHQIKNATIISFPAFSFKWPQRRERWSSNCWENHNNKIICSVEHGQSCTICIVTIITAYNKWETLRRRKNRKRLLCLADVTVREILTQWKTSAGRNVKNDIWHFSAALRVTSSQFLALTLQGSSVTAVLLEVFFYWSFQYQK